MAEYDIAVIGGDKRIAYMIPFFMEKGYRVIGYKVYRPPLLWAGFPLKKRVL